MPLLDSAGFNRISPFANWRRLRSQGRRMRPLMVAALTGLIWLYSAVPVEAQRYYSGVWDEGTDRYAMWVGQSWDSFEAKWKELSGNDRRLVDLEVYTVNGKQRYAGVWREGNDAHYLYVGKSWHDFVIKWEELNPKGLRLIDIETYTVDGKRRWAGVWRAGAGGYFLWVGQKWGSFQDKWNELKGKGLRLIDIEVYHTDSGWRYAGVWQAGNDKHYLWVNKNWSDFKAKWDELKGKNLRLVDLETYKVDGKRRYAGVWREGSDKFGLWSGVDYENFRTKWFDWAQEGRRLIDIESYGISCSSTCLSKVSGGRTYNRKIDVTDMHCSGKPDSCSKPLRAGATAETTVGYRRPVRVVGETEYPILEMLYPRDEIFTLPFTDGSVDFSASWIYSGGSHHYAVDYNKDGGEKTFDIKAAAPGRVIYIGWQWNSGNTVVVSHDVGNRKDAYRTVYMHLRNGKATDCAMSWSGSVAKMRDDGDSRLGDYTDYLEDSGCPETGSQDPEEDFWGKNSETIPNTLGKNVKRGDKLGKAGNTGPGGKLGGSGQNHHLHIKFAQRNPEDGLWYLFDPYGIYATPSCYADGVDDPLGSCARYPTVWRNGRPRKP
jgi:hypothetical protein